MSQRAFWVALVLFAILTSCTPEKETEDPNAPYKQSLLPAF